MSTAAFDAVAKIPERISELRSLSSKARQLRDSEEHVYNALCRACAVLIASHIEGSIKDICDSVRIDLNYFMKEFRQLPVTLKRTFCHKIAYYEGVDGKDIDIRISQLIDFFERNTVPVELEAFPYLESTNKNPKPSNIDKPFEKFGVNGALSAMGSDFLLQVFSDSPKKNYIIKRELIRRRSSLYTFPYKIADQEIFLDPKSIKKKPYPGSLWNTYFEEIVTRRHKIAHGDIIENPTTVDQLDQDIFKAEIVLYSLAIYFCGKVSLLLKE